MYISIWNQSIAGGTRTKQPPLSLCASMPSLPRGCSLTNSGFSVFIGGTHDGCLVNNFESGFEDNMVVEDKI
jgi:hypothetical protein